MPNYKIIVQQVFPIWFKEHASFRLYLSMPYISFSSHDFNHVVFSCFWGTQMMSKAQEGGEDFDEDLFALACGPHSNVKTYSMCAVNLVRFVTIDREKGKKHKIAESQLVEIMKKLIHNFMVSSRKSKS